MAHGVREAQVHKGRPAGLGLVGCGATMDHAQCRRRGGRCLWKGVEEGGKPWGFIELEEEKKSCVQLERDGDEIHEGG